MRPKKPAPAARPSQAAEKTGEKAGKKPGKSGDSRPGPGKKTPAAKPLPEDDPTRYGDWQVKGRCIDF